ncbi:SMI1/KNR4 family protein [Streptomyces sp. WAC 01529]|uniref:SMI1/KNR4 family protein n=1 Tax=Streptomyces sp. WAC 01529 TaxID=2203205 RepID=UPI000F6FA68A|nr:SMI1/KNR4 family protein [Streptomyces sp. WAC 01529]AZM51209.1 SMI1/KNR4 family protein [Streptomyces sp. WAC 01529]
MDGRTAREQNVAWRQIDDAWQRIESWLERNAPATMASLLPGASEAEIEELQESLGVRLPVGLRALWSRRAGVGPDSTPGFMPRECVLMSFEVVRRVYERQMFLRRQDEEAQQRTGDTEEITVWRPSWIPFASIGADALSGLCLDAETGRIWYWCEYAERSIQFESLTDYVEEMADVLEVPLLAEEARVGLMNGFLVWGVPQDAAERAAWEPLAG